LTPAAACEFDERGRKSVRRRKKKRRLRIAGIQKITQIRKKEAKEERRRRNRSAEQQADPHT
jgi:hypothetical protein